jgi:hypothetical protein
VTRCNMVKMVKMVIFMIWVGDDRVGWGGEREMNGDSSSLPRLPFFRYGYMMAILVLGAGSGWEADKRMGQPILSI